MNKKYIIGIDLGGTKISGAISDADGNILNDITVETASYEGVEPVIFRIKGIVSHLLKVTGINREDVYGIGIGSPGPLDSKKGIIANAVNIKGFIDIPIVSILENEFNIKTYLDNDANAAALGELWFGAGKGCKNFIYITVSTGIGSGIVIDGDIYSGTTGNAGELGHTTVDINGVKCNCGNYGCLETISSGTAIGRIARERLSKGEESMLREYSAVTSKEVFECAAKGDRMASEVIDYSIGHLGIAIANVVAIFDPEKVIIGGGVSKAGEVVFKKIREVVRTRCFKTMADTVQIVPAGLGTNAGVAGAIGIVLSKIRKNEHLA